jgi:hypothetical protein
MYLHQMTVSPNTSPQGSYLGNTLIMMGDSYENGAEDGDFIAHAPRDISALIKEVERLRELLNEVEGLAEHQEYSLQDVCFQLLHITSQA